MRLACCGAAGRWVQVARRTSWAEVGWDATRWGRWLGGVGDQDGDGVAWRVDGLAGVWRAKRALGGARVRCRGRDFGLGSLARTPVVEYGSHFFFNGIAIPCSLKC